MIFCAFPSLNKHSKLANAFDIKEMQEREQSLVKELVLAPGTSMNCESLSYIWGTTNGYSINVAKVDGNADLIIRLIFLTKKKIAEMSRSKKTEDPLAEVVL